MENEVSFTTQVKEEICSIDFSDERKRAILSAFIRTNGRFSISSEGESIILTSENAKIAKYIFSLIQNLFGISGRFSFTKSMRFKKRTVYSVIIDHHADDLLSDLEIDFLEGKISKSIAYNDDTIGGYIDGVFLSSGSVNSPITSNYHLEISVDNDNYAKWLSKLILKYKNVVFTPKIIKRRNSYVIYFKKSEQISDFLILLGATNSCMEFENVRVDRDFSNIGNRWQNCDSANFSKTVGAAKLQIEDIKLIDLRFGIDNLKNEKLRELAHLRLENEDSSMIELSRLLSEKLNKEISKSNVAHLFRKLHEIATTFAK